MDSDRSSSKSSDIPGRRSEDNLAVDNRRNSLGTRIDSYLPEDTLIEPGQSIADGRGAEDASQTLDGNLPRTVSYSTHVQSSNKPSQKHSDTLSPRKVSPQASKIDMGPKKPLVPKLKLSKVQLYKGVPKPLLTP